MLQVKLLSLADRICCKVHSAAYTLLPPGTEQAASSAGGKPAGAQQQASTPLSQMGELKLLVEQLANAGTCQQHVHLPWSCGEAMLVMLDCCMLCNDATTLHAMSLAARTL
jgi:hypothetical protein